jgi:hypothetical protein
MDLVPNPRTPVRIGGSTPTICGDRHQKSPISPIPWTEALAHALHYVPA